MTTLIENFFTEERRIQGLIDDAVREERQRSKNELEKKYAELEKLKANEISHMLELGVSPERIVEVTGFTPEFVNEVLNKNR